MKTGRRAAGCVALGLCVAVLAASAPAAGPAAHQARLDPSLSAWLAEGAGGSPRAETPDNLQILVGPTGEVRIKVLATTTKPMSGARLGGVPVGFSTGSVGTLVVSRDELASVIADPQVTYVEPSWQTHPALDESVPAIGANLAHAASPPIDGEGAIVGVVDTGIDVRHLDFRYDEDGDGHEESSRVLALLDQTRGLSGVIYSKEDIEADLASGDGPGSGIVRETDRDGHGTHVAGIAAGDGTSSSAGFCGVAPRAWIVAVKTTFFTADILEGVSYVFEEAARRGLPAVVNLSLGGQEGPHDGTSAFERGLYELAQGAGRAIVVAAGNEGDVTLHASGTLQGGTRSFDLEAGSYEIALELWYPGTSRFTVSLSSPAGTSLSAPTGGRSGFVATPNGVAYIDNASDGVNPSNDDRQALVRITNTTSGTRWRVTIRDDGGGGRFDGWVTTDEGRIVGGDSASTIDEPGNARGAITVGAFNTKAEWPSAFGDQDMSDEVQIGVLSDFSSQGPTRDGRTKPDLAAPGTWIASSLSSAATAIDSFVHPDRVHVMRRGTSMAAPHVSGTIALLFSVNPRLTSAQILELLTTTAERDRTTGSVPNPRWGYGKLDAWAALQAVVPFEPPTPSGSRPTIRATENPVSRESVFVVELLEGTRDADLRIYDMAGRRIFEDDVVGTSVTWNLRTDDGEHVAAGLYLYILVTDKGTSTVGKLVVAP